MEATVHLIAQVLALKVVEQVSAPEPRISVLVVLF
jgi:hypothetical protein